MNQKTLMMIYHSLIYPYLIYAVPIWGNAADNFIDSIYKLQKRVVRYITFKDSRTHSAPLFNSLNILNIRDIYKIDTLKFVHDCLNRHNPPQFHYYYNYSASTYNTASFRDNKLYTPLIRTTTYGLNSLMYNGAVLWNNVPLSIRISPSRKLLAKNLKKLFLSSYT